MDIPGTNPAQTRHKPAQPGTAAQTLRCTPATLPTIRAWIAETPGCATTLRALIDAGLIKGLRGSVWTKTPPPQHPTPQAGPQNAPQADLAALAGPTQAGGRP